MEVFILQNLSAFPKIIKVECIFLNLLEDYKNHFLICFISRKNYFSLFFFTCLFNLKFKMYSKNMKKA